jgi:UDP-N-acetylmuramoyl-tripeptide--D-alanyl-D-alanine ligase
VPAVPVTSVKNPLPLPRRWLLGLKLRILLPAARTHRGWLSDVAFIGITGSAGKTTTKELVAAVLSTRSRGTQTPGGANSPAAIASTVLRTRRRDSFCVVEIAAGFPGDVARVARVVRPEVAAVTRIGSDHYKTFRSLEATAAEKRRLLEHVVAGGTAVLNADDPHVLAMREGFPEGVLTFGCSPDVDLRALDVRAAWPERLSFTLHHREQSLPVRTLLCGKHWVPSVLAALGVTLALGVPLEQSVPALADVPPLPSRMSPIFRQGVTFILDDVKAPRWALGSAFAFLAEARAERKVAVLGTISDYPGASSQVYARTAEQAAAVADEVVFVGPNSRHALKARGHGERGLSAWATLPEAKRYLEATLRAGDLVLVKGSQKADGLASLIAMLDLRNQ